MQVDLNNGCKTVVVVALISYALLWMIAQLRRERFVEELESYSKQVEEFQTFGDMAEVPKYLKKAQSLDDKLQTAADRVKRVALFDIAMLPYFLCYPG